MRTSNWTLIAIALAGIGRAADAQCPARWESLGGGLVSQDGHWGVLAMEHFNGQLYAGGGFHLADGAIANRIARWNGESWMPVQQGITSTIASNHTVAALKAHDGKLYVAGRWFTHAGTVPAANIAAWNDSEWESLNGGVGVGEGLVEVKALEVYDGDLIIGGTFTTAGSIAANRIVRWDGKEFHPLGAGISGSAPIPSVSAMRVFNGELYVAGSFNTAGGVAVQNIAKWNGSTWSAVGTLQPICRSLEVFDGSLFAAGGHVVPGSYLAVLDGSQWSPAGVGFNSFIFTMQNINGRLHFGGWFTSAGDIAANHVAAWDGRTWSTFDLPAENGCNDAVHVFAPVIGGPVDAVIVGGDFTNAGGVASGQVAQWTCQPCAADFTGDWTVNVDDLLFVIGGWGRYDLDDLLMVVNAWGWCQ